MYITECSYIVFLEWLACLSQETKTLVVDTEQHDGARGGSGSEGDRVTRFSVSLIEVGGHLKDRVSDRSKLFLSLSHTLSPSPSPSLSPLFLPPSPSPSLTSLFLYSTNILHCLIFPLLLLIPGVISLLASKKFRAFTLFNSPHCHDSPIKSLPCVWRSTGRPLQWGQQQALHPHEQILQELWPWAPSRGWREMRQLLTLYRFSGIHKHGAERCLERLPK